MGTFLRLTVALASASALLLGVPATVGSTPVASSDELYEMCGRVFPDAHAYWPLPAQAPERSPFAKGNAVCAATDFMTHGEMVAGLEYLGGVRKPDGTSQGGLLPGFVEFYELERDFGSGSDCTSATSNAVLCSAGLPRQGVPTERVRSDLHLLRVTDERIPDEGKKLFVFPVGIHGIERAGVEAGVRAAEDLATWAACEAGLAPAIVDCAQEGAIPHPILETQPETSLTAGDVLRRSAIYFVFANPDGWRRGDPDNLVRSYQRYNGNGVDLNRDWPQLGFTFRPYTPWSEPESRGFGRVLREISPRWHGGIDLHGQLIDRAFSFTMFGNSPDKTYAKNQRLLQVVRGAWADAEERFAWATAYIKPNDAPPRCSDTGGEQPCDERMYGVQWGTIWDTIGYTVTGSLGDWIESPQGLGADGLDNEMSLSHLSNCGTGTCYLSDFEQLHIDGNKSLVYGMVNFTLDESEDTTFPVPGKVGYVFNPRVVENAGEPGPSPVAGLEPQEGETTALDATRTSHEFLVRGLEDDVYNGGLEAKITHVNVGGAGGGSGVPSVSGGTSLILERYRPEEPPPPTEDGCGVEGGDWEEINRYYNQSSIYLQAGQAVHANSPQPGRWRVCLQGGLVSQWVATGGGATLEIGFSTEQAWADPGQLPYSVTNMKFFQDLAGAMAPDQLVAVNVDDVLAGSVDLDGFTSLVVADEALPGYSEGVPTGPAQEGFTVADPGAGTAPCAYSPGLQPVLPPTCVRDHEFDVGADFNNQTVTIALRSDPESADWDLYVERQSRINGEWFAVGSSTTPTGNETVNIQTPPPGHYRARVVNWDAADPTSAKTLTVGFSNEYAGPEIPPSERTDAERDDWGAKLRAYAEGGGNLVLTDGALRNLGYMDAVGGEFVNTFSVFAGYVGFTRDGRSSTYDDPLAAGVNQPGAAEGPGFRHQTYEPVPLGFDIGDSNNSTAPVYAVDQIEWERLGGRTVGVSTADQVTLGELKLGEGVVRVIGALLPMPTDRYYHPFGLASHALTYTGYQVLANALQWTRPLPDLALSPADISLSTERVAGADEVTITAAVRNVGGSAAASVSVRFTDNGAQIGDVQQIASIAAGEAGSASVVWSVKHLKGERTIEVTADHANAIEELDETNNSASRTVDVRGNKVQNGSFESSSSGSAPDNWSSSGGTTYAEGGSDGERSVTADATGAWVSDPIDVTPGASYGTSVSVSGASGVLVVEQLSAEGVVLATETQTLAGVSGVFQAVAGALTAAEGVAQVRLTLRGGLLGTTFDDVRLWEE
jgi:hypothetical protein